MVPEGSWLFRIVVVIRASNALLTMNFLFSEVQNNKYIINKVV